MTSTPFQTAADIPDDIKASVCASNRVADLVRIQDGTIFVGLVTLDFIEEMSAKLAEGIRADREEDDWTKWSKAEIDQSIESGYGHAMALLLGNTDPDTGLGHEAAVACRAMFNSYHTNKERLAAADLEDKKGNIS